MARKVLPSLYILTPDGRLRIRRAVAYVGEQRSYVNALLQPATFMLSVYALASEQKTKLVGQQWRCVARKHAVRTTSEEAQLALLDMLTHKAALDIGLDFHIEIEARTKKPSRVSIVDNTLKEN